MAVARARTLQIVLAFLASIIFVALIPTTSHAHGNSTPTTPAIAVLTSAALTEPHQILSAAEPIAMMPAGDLGAQPDAGGAPCPTDGCCCSAACHMAIEFVGPVLGARVVAASRCLPLDIGLVFDSPFIGLFRPPRSV